MFPYFWCRWIFRIIFTSINLFYYILKICINGVLSDFWYWLNSNILVSSAEGILMLHTLLWDSTFFCSKRLKTNQTIKKHFFFRVIPLNNVYIYFYFQIMFLRLFSMQNMKSNCYIIFLNFFPIFWQKIYSFPPIFIYKWFIFCYSLWIYSNFFIV